MKLADFSLRVDPWGPEYDRAVALPEEEAACEVDLGVEGAGWRALRAAPGPCPPLAFVDGVRRVEHRLLLEREGRVAFALLGSFAVGAAQVEAGVSLRDAAVGRVLATGGALETDALEVGAGGQRLRFEPESARDNTPLAPLGAFQAHMRRAEAALAERLAAEGLLVLRDGLLTPGDHGPRPVVGYVKTLQQSYLPPTEAALLPRLEVGERTPLFLIVNAAQGADWVRYSWYLRLAHGRRIESALTGVVRLEVSAAFGLDAARARADLLSAELPRFAASSVRDARAPQNLYPIGGLEAHLKHLLGDGELLRRAIEQHLHAAVA